VIERRAEPLTNFRDHNSLILMSPKQFWNILESNEKYIDKNEHFVNID